MGFPSGVSLDLSLRSEGNPQGLLEETGLVRVIFIMAIVLRGITVLAFHRTGGLQDLGKHMEDLRERSEQASDSARDLTTDGLIRFEFFIRRYVKIAFP